ARHGPATLIVDAGSAEPVALYDAFGVYPLHSAGNSLDWLVESVAQMRHQDAFLEPVLISLSSVAKVAVVRIRHGGWCTEDRLWADGKVVVTSPPCPLVEGAAAYSIEPI